MSPSFDFPASPSSGQVYTPTGGPSYQWDGEKWKGGQPSGPQTEQFIDLSGKTQQDIVVPTWAKVAKFNATVLPSNATPSVFCLRVSTDGTTFLTGAADYHAAGFNHFTGSGGFANAAGTSSNLWSLTGAHDNAENPIVVDGQLSVSRVAVPPVFAGMVRSKHYNAAATSLYSESDLRISLYSGAGSSLTLKALRFFSSAGTAWGGGSSLKIEWLGDAAQVPISNAIAEAPNDSNVYLRGQNTWKSGGTLSSALSIPFVGTYTQNGYTKLPNGIIIQWAKINVAADAILNFPIAFPVGVINVQVTPTDALATTALVAGTVDQVALATYAFRPRYATSGGAVGIATQFFYMLAIGW
jgi:hypothetical protein